MKRKAVLEFIQRAKLPYISGHSPAGIRKGAVSDFRFWRIGLRVSLFKGILDLYDKGIEVWSPWLSSYPAFLDIRGRIASFGK